MKYIGKVKSKKNAKENYLVFGELHICVFKVFLRAFPILLSQWHIGNLDTRDIFYYSNLKKSQEIYTRIVIMMVLMVRKLLIFTFDRHCSFQECFSSWIY